ncbi:hypothetical protein ENKNEFLB_00781 [Nocardioides aquaticus]|uniref:Sulfotransferase domain-containing protein n=1 Tax=Nocardioides aquaticus TaxID=160826 RepID=A0ABX8ED57_9ACTN|nr:sulfotransferase [Nocardioides aquaticus]QVT78404.1 hypothetical protein ENKNEFLB_00781 [Nocardioides aquaticus]
MSAAVEVGPDLVIAGAARSGTSFLASVLGQHPQVDPCAVKEPNYFSREHDRGPGWYDGLFTPRRPGKMRLDASMSYTYAHFPDALDHLADAAPDAFVVYAVRHPVARLVSHMQLHRDYFRNESARTLGEALRSTDIYAGASDYAHWLPRLEKHFGPDRLLVVPFPVVTKRLDELLPVLSAATGLATEPFTDAGETAGRHRNQVVEVKSSGILAGRRLVRRWGLYPALRRTLGPERLRKVRDWSTRPVETESVTTALATCDDEQHGRLEELYASARLAAATSLRAQDVRLGLSWAEAWEQECPAPGVRGTDW